MWVVFLLNKTGHFVSFYTGMKEDDVHSQNKLVEGDPMLKRFLQSVALFAVLLWIRDYVNRSIRVISKKWARTR